MPLNRSSYSINFCYIIKILIDNRELHLLVYTGIDTHLCRTSFKNYFLFVIALLCRRRYTQHTLNVWEQTPSSSVPQCEIEVYDTLVNVINFFKLFMAFKIKFQSINNNNK